MSKIAEIENCKLTQRHTFTLDIQMCERGSVQILAVFGSIGDFGNSRLRLGALAFHRMLRLRQQGPNAKEHY